MNQPRVKDRPNSWLFTWDQPYSFTMRIDRPKQHSNGTVSAEITVVSGDDPTTPTGHLHHSFMSNLLGPKVRGDIAKALSERVSEVPWGDCLEIALEHVIKRVRQGEPASRLKDTPLPEGSRWRLAPILQEGHPTMLFGYGGSLKSYLAHYWGLRVALGIDAVRGNVLVLDWEGSHEEWRERQLMMCESLGVEEPENIYYRRCFSPLTSELNEIMDMAGEVNAELVIIDSAAYASGDEPEKSVTAKDFFNGIRALRATSLIVAHQNSDVKSNKPFGSIFWENGARSTVQVKRAEATESSVTVGLFNQKVNYVKRFKPFAIQADFHIFTDDHYSPGDYVSFRDTRLADISELAQEGTSADKVLSFLMDHGPQKPAEIENATKVKGIRQVLKRLVDRGEIAVDSASRYTIVTPPSHVTADVTEGLPVT